jgi:hypothetical protein
MLLPSNCPQDHSHQPITMAEKWRGDSSQYSRGVVVGATPGLRGPRRPTGVSDEGSSQQQPQHRTTSTRRAARAWGGVDDWRQWRHEGRHGTHRAGPRQRRCVESTAQAPDDESIGVGRQRAKLWRARVLRS